MLLWAFADIIFSLLVLARREHRSILQKSKERLRLEAASVLDRFWLNDCLAPHSSLHDTQREGLFPLSAAPDPLTQICIRLNFVFWLTAT